MANHLSKALKGVSFYKMPKIPYDILFHRQSLKNDCYYDDKLIRAPFSLIQKAFVSYFDHMDFHKEPDAKILFYISDPLRTSNENDFKKAVGTVIKAESMIERHNKGRFSFLGFFLFFILMPIWYFQMSGHGLYLIEKYQVLKSLLEVYRVNLIFKKIDVKKYNLLVCFYDSIVHECLLALIFKASKVKTASLQHGIFNAWRENTFVNCGLELLSSPCDYQLCWNRFVRDEALKCGWKYENLPIVGILSNIGRGKEVCVKPNNGIFGVVISHPSWEHENIEMIKAANILASKYNYRYYLKLHPNYKEDYFKDSVDAAYYIGNVKKGIDTLEYCNMVDFTIVGSTSFYVEMVYCYHDIIRYSSKLPSDKYKDIEDGCVFGNASEIVLSYQNLDKRDKSFLFEYLCHSCDTFNSYKEFFDKFK